MKIGFCGNAGNLKNFSSDIIDYIEVSLSEVKEMSAEKIKELVSVSNDSGIPIETANCFFPPEIKLCGKAYSKNILKSYCREVLHKGAELGVQIAVVGSGSSRKIEDDDNAHECLEQLAESFFCVADAAKEYGITIVAEPLSKGDTNTVNTVKDGAEFVRLINHSNLFLLADIFHMSKENESYQSIVDNGDIIRHIHIARGETRKFPACGDGFDYFAVKSALDKIEYDMRISIEGLPYNDFDGEISDSVKFLKDIWHC